ncbi:MULTISPECIES: hypothetical protein [unclassified Rathayibacter]|uniref:hypothetical protein n=1 Tax=unclassified Rathayibacter TaxID=2609250 RepID=UPI00188CE6A0|nr:MULTISPECIES: hypothetical protein [unclassified Rathayibacter]MBF4461288.1 hypothetical protein [Rathayibacter sp. VKM Ac-2879]MBF4502699.1 hypothetical protein [Rathayibacter sp. VKM Ac-2878]
MDLTRHITDAVARYWADDVQILGAWPDGPAGACVVYRRTIDPTVTLGHRFQFTANAADGTLEGYARDIAINLAEPIGAAARTSRPDGYGIVWVAVAENEPTPRPPVEVVERLRAWPNA